MEDSSFLDRILKLQRKANENPFMAFEVQTLQDEESDDDEEEDEEEVCEENDKSLNEVNIEKNDVILRHLPDKIV